MLYINRTMETTFKRMARQFTVILLTGPRQVGKTTMLKKLAMEEGNNREYVSLDDINERNLAKKTPSHFCSSTSHLYLLTKCSMHLNFSLI